VNEACRYSASVQTTPCGAREKRIEVRIQMAAGRAASRSIVRRSAGRSRRGKGPSRTARVKPRARRNACTARDAGLRTKTNQDQSRAGRCCCARAEAGLCVCGRRRALSVGRRSWALDEPALVSHLDENHGNLNRVG